MPTIIPWDHKHHYEIQRVIHMRYRPRVIRFMCTICYEFCERYPERIWKPSKMVSLTEQNIPRMAAQSKYTEDEIRKIYRDAIARGSQSVFMNLVRQLDGSWTNEPLMIGEFGNA